MITVRRTHPAQPFDAWIDDFVVSLRVREVPGARIGDLVAEVEGHLAESGESPADAFGAPSDYAAQRAAEIVDVAPSAPSRWAATLAPTVAGVMGVILLMPALAAFKRHTSVGIAWGQLVALVMLGATCVVLVRWMEPLLLRRGLGAVVLGVIFLVMVLLPIVLRATAFTVPAVMGLVIAVGLIALSVVGQSTWAHVDADPVAHPLSGADRYASRRFASRVADLTISSQAWSFVVLGVVLGVVTWIGS